MAVSAGGLRRRRSLRRRGYVRSAIARWDRRWRLRRGRQHRRAVRSLWRRIRLCAGRIGDAARKLVWRNRPRRLHGHVAVIDVADRVDADGPRSHGSVDVVASPTDELVVSVNRHVERRIDGDITVDHHNNAYADRAIDDVGDDYDHDHDNAVDQHDADVADDHGRDDAHVADNHDVDDHAVDLGHVHSHVVRGHEQPDGHDRRCRDAAVVAVPRADT